MASASGLLSQSLGRAFGFCIAPAEGKGFRVTPVEGKGFRTTPAERKIIRIAPVGGKGVEYFAKGTTSLRSNCGTRMNLKVWREDLTEPFEYQQKESPSLLLVQNQSPSLLLVQNQSPSLLPIGATEIPSVRSPTH